MANRRPLIINASAQQIQELPSGDDLIGITDITVTGTSTADSFVGNGTIPVGGIIMWSGSTASIPTGWAICNGSNSTPNLTNRFVVGAGSGYAVDATGGSADAVIVEHNHSYSNFSNPGNHVHSYTRFSGTANTDNDESHQRLNGSTTADTDGAGSHIHSFDIDNQGVSGTNANLPPYYALAYIMRTS